MQVVKISSLFFCFFLLMFIGCTNTNNEAEANVICSENNLNTNKIEYLKRKSIDTTTVDSIETKNGDIYFKMFLYEIKNNNEVEKRFCTIFFTVNNKIIITKSYESFVASLGGNVYINKINDNGFFILATSDHTDYERLDCRIDWSEKKIYVDKSIYVYYGTPYATEFRTTTKINKTVDDYEKDEAKINKNDTSNTLTFEQEMEQLETNRIKNWEGCIKFSKNKQHVSICRNKDGRNIEYIVKFTKNNDVINEINYSKISAAGAMSTFESYEFNTEFVQQNNNSFIITTKRATDTETQMPIYTTYYTVNWSTNNIQVDKIVFTDNDWSKLERLANDKESYSCILNIDKPLDYFVENIDKYIYEIDEKCNKRMY